MKVDRLIQLAERRQAYLEAQKTTAENIGDIDAVIRADTELAEVQATLAKLRAIPAG
jgi:hypothetical protein